MTRYNPWLHRFALGSAVATLVLLCFGGLVTSHGAGLAVPDWPNSYGYNMFLFPVSKWVGGIFYEHTHRLIASGVGFLTIILAVWLWRKEGRTWLRWLGVGALILVIFQGVLGGLRVTLLKDELGIFHATLAQLFFVLISAIALFTSRWWQDPQQRAGELGRLQPFRRLVGLITLLTLLQLTLGAAMRHQHAGLAIPDFPLAYGQVWPAMNPDALARYNQQRLEGSAQNPITASGVALHMVHRLTAGLIFLGVLATAWRARAKVLSNPLLAKLSLGWLALMAGQVSLGAFTIWSNKSADVATAHVAVGALSLMLGAMIFLVSRRHQPLPLPGPLPTPSEQSLPGFAGGLRSAPNC